MSLKSAMELLNKIDASPMPIDQIIDALNTVVNSHDVAHMNRKSLFNGLRYVVQNLNSLSVVSEDDNEKAENTVL